MTFDNLSGWKGYHYCEDGATQEETEVQDNPKSRKIFNTKDPLMHFTQKKLLFFFKIFNCAMSNPASRSGKLLIWYLPANDIHQKKEDLETS